VAALAVACGLEATLAPTDTKPTDKPTGDKPIKDKEEQ
jgi:hypothetical protein